MNSFMVQIWSLTGGRERLFFLGAQHEDLLLDTIKEVTKHFLIRFFQQTNQQYWIFKDFRGNSC